MTLKQLQYFLTIAKTGNMSRASEELNVSQPPLSYQIKALEEELGCPLFIRSKKGMSLSKSGELLADRAHQILTLVDKTTNEIRRSKKEFASPVRVGAITSVSNSILPNKLVEFHKLHPDTHVQIYEGGTDDIVGMLNNDKADIGVTREPFNKASFNYQPLKDNLDSLNGHPDSFISLSDDEFFDLGTGNTIDLAALEGKPILIHRYHESTVSAYCKQLGFEPNIITMSSDVLSLISWARSGMGIAVMPLSSSMLNPNHGLRAMTVVNPIIPSRRYVLWKKGVELSIEADDLVKLLT